MKTDGSICWLSSLCELNLPMSIYWVSEISFHLD